MPKFNLLRRDVAPFLLSLLALAAAAILADAALHLLKLVWVGRYLGIPGVLLIAGSFGYSLRKRQLIAFGKPVPLLRLHERMAWAGSLLVLVHAGIHFNAILAWLAVGAMLVNIVSGLTGKYLLQRARKHLDAERLALKGRPAAEVDDALYWDTLTVEVIKRWRVIHIPITLAFTVLALAHILSVFLFWGWR